MMINKRLISARGNSKKYIFLNVAVQWFRMHFNILMIFTIANLFQIIKTKKSQSVPE